jgi:hypothetical protein
MLVKQFHYISKEESQMVLESIKYIKHKVIVLLMLDAGLQFQKRAALNAKFLILKSKYHNSISKKEDKTLANYSNIKPTLSSYRRIFKRMKFQ